jgi:hypothetical protein
LNLGMAREELRRRMDSMSGSDDSPLTTVSDKDADRVRDNGELGRGRGGFMSRSSVGSWSMMKERWRVKDDGPAMLCFRISSEGDGYKGDDGEIETSVMADCIASSVLGPSGVGEMGD